MPTVKLPFTLVTGCTACILILSHVTRSGLMTSWGYDDYCLNLAQVVQYQQCEFSSGESAVVTMRFGCSSTSPPPPPTSPLLSIFFSPPLLSFPLISSYSPPHSYFSFSPLSLSSPSNSSLPGYRVFTFGVVYYNFVHLVIVTTALLTLGIRMEQHIGSLYLFNALLVLAVVVPLLHLLVEVAVVYFYRDLLYECFVGISSILCAMFVLEVSRAKKHWESILGYCSLSWWAFPWLAAILCEVITRDHIAFLGHVAGILAGHMCILPAFARPFLCMTAGWEGYALISGLWSSTRNNTRTPDNFWLTTTLLSGCNCLC